MITRQIVRVPAAIASFPSHAVAVSLHAVRPSVVAGTLAACVATAALLLAAEGKPPRAEGAPVTINAGPDWVPLDVDLDIEPGSALDFSKVLPRHAPAGKFGRLIATKQGKFAFENCAVPMRFYGVDLCCTAQYLSRELADRLAERLVRLGYNAVRNHHYERWLVDREPGEMRLRGDTLDQFDYLFAAFKQRGIYVTTDLYVSRLVALADVYEDRSRSAGAGQTKTADRAENWTFENYYNVGPGDFGVYVDHPQYLSHLRLPPSRSGNANAVAGGGLGCRDSAFSRLLDKPFTITEFNYCGPGQYRGVAGLLTGALAALQDWDGLWRHVYSYNRENITRPAAMYYVDVAADPLTQAAERAGLCLFLRDDLQPAKHSVAITSTPDALLASAAVSRDRAPAWSRLAWLTRVGWRIGAASQATEHELPLVFPMRPIRWRPATRRRFSTTLPSRAGCPRPTGPT